MLVALSAEDVRATGGQALNETRYAAADGCSVTAKGRAQQIQSGVRLASPTGEAATNVAGIEAPDGKGIGELSLTIGTTDGAVQRYCDPSQPRTAS